MSKIYHTVSTCVPSREGEAAYVFAITPTVQNGLATITSADELLVLDRQDLAHSPILRLRDVPQKVSCLVSGGAEGATVLCAGGDGVVSIHDVRMQTRSSHFKTDRAITALACQEHQVAVGTELAHYQAVVSLWDCRQNRQLWQNAENNDDITALDFHPSRHNLLLSGGDDGQVSIFDVSVAEEDDSLIQGLNYGPIHKAGFLGNHRFFALSSDQNFSVHALSASDDADDPQPTDFGDLRSLIPCEYVIDVFRNGQQYVVATGSNNNDPRIDLVELQSATDLTQSPSLVSSNTHRLADGHGEEIVRSLFADAITGTIFTAGEDGHINAFRQSEATVTASTAPKSSKVKKGSDVRYKPY